MKTAARDLISRNFQLLRTNIIDQLIEKSVISIHFLLITKKNELKLSLDTFFC